MDKWKQVVLDKPMSLDEVQKYADSGWLLHWVHPTIGAKINHVFRYKDG